MTKDMLEKCMPEPSNQTMILICGPPVFTDLMMQFLAELGYEESMYFKF